MITSLEGTTYSLKRLRAAVTIIRLRGAIVIDARGPRGRVIEVVRHGVGVASFEGPGFEGQVKGDRRWRLSGTEESRRKTQPVEAWEKFWYMQLQTGRCAWVAMRTMTMMMVWIDEPVDGVGGRWTETKKGGLDYAACQVAGCACVGVCVAPKARCSLSAKQPAQHPVQCVQ